MHRFILIALLVTSACKKSKEEQCDELAKMGIAIADELALDVARQTAALRIGVAQLGDQRLRVTGDELVQHGSLGRTTPVPAERLSGCAGRSFVEAAGEHVPVL